MKLKSWKYLPDGKVEFVFDNGQTVILKEKNDWPVLGMLTLKRMEAWLHIRYLHDINFATFGAVLS